MRIGVIGGTGLYGLGGDATPEDVRVDTPYGPRTVHVLQPPDADPVFFLNRHGTHHTVPPHRIDHRANIDTLALCRVDAILAIHNVGGLRHELNGGQIVVPHDLVDIGGLAGRTDGTFHDDDVVHIDMSEPYCPHVRQAWIDAARAHVHLDHVHAKGVYVAVRGPRLETPAEVAFLASLGDIVGMTGCPEAALARERGICYASLSFVANAAAGLGGALSAEGIRAALGSQAELVQRIITDAMGRIPPTRECGCRAAPEAGRLASVPPE